MTETESTQVLRRTIPFRPRNPLMRFFTKSVHRRIASTDWRKIKRARNRVVREMKKHYNPNDVGDCMTLFANIQCLKKVKWEAKINAAIESRRAERLAAAVSV